MSWIKAKDACLKINIGYEGLVKAIKRHIQGGAEPKFKYRYIDGKGRGGKTLEIWIEDEKKSEEHELPQPTQKSLHVNTEDNSFSMQRYMLATKAEQKEALRKAQLVKSYVERERWVTFEDWSKDKAGLPSKQHFLRWVKLYKKGIQHQNVINAFIDSRGRPKGTLKMTKEMQEMCERYILRRDIHPNNRGIYENLKIAFGSSLPSFATIDRFIIRYKKENKRLVDFARNPDKARGKYMAAFGNASAKAKYKNHFWELDGTKADVMCSDGKRPTIIAAIDIYTRRVVLTVEDKSNSYALARNLRAGMLTLGIPENVITDNGRDYTSNHFNSVCSNLKINKKEVPPYSGWCKPHVERFFGTMTRELFRQLEGFVGHNVAERSAIQDGLSYEQKIEARKKWKAQNFSEKSFANAMKKETMQIFIPLTLDELNSWLQAWNTAIYEQRVHSSLGVTPMQKYIEDITPAKVVTDKKMLDILLGEWTEMTVSKKGVVIRRYGKEAEYTHPALIEFIGEKVFVALGEDMGEAYIYQSDMTPLCVAKDASLEGINREQIKNLHKEMRKLESETAKRVKQAEELAQKMADPTIKNVVELAAKDIKLDRRSKIKLAAKVDIEVPEEKEVMINGRPLFESDFDAFVWAIENNRVDEFALLIEKQEETFQAALREVENRKRKETA